MIARIVTALDKSACGRQAVALAAQIAGESGAFLVALAIMGGYAMNRSEVWKAQHEMEELSEEARFLATEAGVRLELRGSEQLPVDALVAEATPADLLVIGRDATYWDAPERTVSEVVAGLLSRAPRPLLLAPSQSVDVHRLLVAFDGSDAASRTLHMLALFGLGTHSRIDVLSIDSDRDRALNLAESAADLLRAHGVESADAIAVRSKSDPAGVILDHVQTARIGIVVMGAYGNGGLREVFFGSCTRRVLESCGCALFVHH